MLSDHLQKLILQHFRFEPTHEQAELCGALSEFVVNDNVNGAFLLKGYAGTGKTTLISSFVKTLAAMEQPFVLLAPTGRAAKVLSGYCGFQAFTIHKYIYRQQSSGDDFGSFSIDYNKNRNTLFFVDEASMISNNSDEFSAFGNGRLLEDLVNYVYNGKNCRLLFIGDLAQLPPVGTLVSPALDPEYLSGLGLTVQQFTLREVVRQSSQSGILQAATQLRKQLADKRFTTFPVFEPNGIDVINLNGEMFIESVAGSYYNVGREEVIIITRSNKRANLFNQGVRNSVLYREEEITNGDLLMVVKNNYHWSKAYSESDFIANGEMGEVVRIKKHHHLYGLHFAEATLRFSDKSNLEMDVIVLLSTLMHESASLTQKEMQQFYDKVAEDYPEIKSKQKLVRDIRENPFYNALQVKFGYAVTCHKSQGGQWKHVYLDLGYITGEMVDMEFLRWLYTAITRATEKLYLVNFPKEMIGSKTGD